MDTKGLSWGTILRNKEYLALDVEGKARALLSLRHPEDQRFHSEFMERNVTLVSATQHSATTVSAVYKFTVDRFYANGGNTLHGGAQAAIYDMLTSITLQTICTPELWVSAGVSRTLNVSYLRPAPIGMELLCECEVVATGKSLSLQRGVMKRVSDGAVISTCEHHKVAVPSRL